MDHSYNSDEASKAYEAFLASPDGRIFRQVLGDVFLQRLGKNRSEANLLDAGCGDGWLAALLKDRFPTARVEGCDAGEPLIRAAKQKYPKVQFKICDLNKSLPYEKDSFDVITASMVIHDVGDELAALKNIATVLKPGGVLLASIVNPYYGYPVGEWKRGLVGRLLGRKPKLRLARGYNGLGRKHRPSFEWRPHLGSHFTPLETHIQNAHAAGLALTGLADVKSNTDSETYNLTYQLYRFPIILLLEFTKI